MQRETTDSVVCIVWLKKWCSGIGMGLMDYIGAWDWLSGVVRKK